MTSLGLHLNFIESLASRDCLTLHINYSCLENMGSVIIDITHWLIWKTRYNLISNHVAPNLNGDKMRA